ncbi:MAG: phosphoribosylanthranilate isomerase [Gammaproteobacteria bacterium]|nr:phosphoribosylanthranilate isomerase [Gammaproteobacteria bacterium]
MSRLWIKICGITLNSDAIAAAGYGADAIGLVFYPQSPRAVKKKSIAEITTGLPSWVDVVALFVDPSEEEVRQVLATNTINLLQFHGQESEAFCKSFDVPYIKAIRVKNYGTISNVINAYGSAEMLLLDSHSKKAPGGTGSKFDWKIGKSVTEKTTSKIVVAGGLNPNNVQKAIQKIKPYGVDVSSGVEQSHGVKRLSKMKAFIEGARSV